jgi:hypothetical protein
VHVLMMCSAALAQDSPTTPQSTNTPQAAESQPLGTAPAPRVAGAVTSKLLRYAERIVNKYDTNRDRRLEASEYRAMRGQPELADRDRDGAISVDEFAQHVADFAAGRRIRLATPGGAVAEAPSAVASVPTSAATVSPGESTTVDPTALAERRKLKFFAPLPPGVPAWFVERDADGDAQLTLAEFSPRLRSAEINEFNKHDTNGDGLLTTAELSRAAASAPAATEGANNRAAAPQP